MYVATVRKYAERLACRVGMWDIPSMPTAAALQEYDARVDSKKRVTIRGAGHEFFRVTHRPDGTILLKPRVLQDAPISPRTLACIAKSMASLKAGKRSKPVDLKKLAAMKL